MLDVRGLILELTIEINNYLIIYTKAMTTDTL